MSIDKVGGQAGVSLPSSPPEAAPRNAAPAGVASQAASTAQPLDKKPSPSLKQVEEAMQQVQEAVRHSARNLQFSLDSETGTTVVKVVDTQTNEVIRQIPSEEMIKIAQTIDQQLQGLLLKQQA